MYDHAGEQGLRGFYDAFGARHHVERERGGTVISDALADAGLSADLSAFSDTPQSDAALREWTKTAVDPVNGPVGTPILHLGDAAFFGPVLTSIPQGQDAVAAFDAVITLSRIPAFVEYKRGRTQSPQTA